MEKACASCWRRLFYLFRSLFSALIEITVCHSILIRTMMVTCRKHKAQPYGGVTCFQKKG